MMWDMLELGKGATNSLHDETIKMTVSGLLVNFGGHNDRFTY